MKKIIAITGATATGKTELAVKLSKKLCAEIVSCDSMLFYKKMNIGTAKPTKEEMGGIKHHMIDILDIHDDFSVAEYVKAANLCIDNIYHNEKIPIFCGGTGLYIDSLLNSTDFGSFPSLPGYRKELTDFANANGNEKLHELLKKTDPESAAKIDKNNVKRVIRALEIYKATGKTMTRWNEESKFSEKKFDYVKIILEYKDREKLYERINCRVDEMIEKGLVQEARELKEDGLEKCPTAGQAIGYKELFPYFDGKASLSECVEKIKSESRKYAKRQQTWFKRDAEAKRIYVDEMSSEQVFDTAYNICSEFLKPDKLWSLQ